MKLRTILFSLAAVGFCSGAVAQAPIVIKFSHVVAADTPKGKASEFFKKRAEELGKGKVKVEVYANSALYKDKEELEALQLGAVQMLAPSLAKFGPLGVKEFEVFDLPYIFDDYTELHRVTQGPVGAGILKKLEPKGIVGLAYWELGYRQMTNSKRALNKVEDIEGLKLRVIPNPINVAWVKALGANPTPMPFAEVYGGLEQKAIDGQENPIGVIAANKFWEVQKFVAITNHQYNPQSVLFSKKVWDTLSGAERKVLADAAVEAGAVQRSESRALVATNLELLKKNGMTVTSFPPAEVSRLREKMKPVIAQFTASVGEPLVNEVNAELAKLRK